MSHSEHQIAEHRASRAANRARQHGRLLLHDVTAIFAAAAVALATVLSLGAQAAPPDERDQNDTQAVAEITETRAGRRAKRVSRFEPRGAREAAALLNIEIPRTNAEAHGQAQNGKAQNGKAQNGKGQNGKGQNGKAHKQRRSTKGKSPAAARRARMLNSSNPRDIARALMPDYGFAPRQFQYLDKLWISESNWRVHADNPTSSAYGIPQALTQLHDLPAGYMNSAKVQIKWGLNYIKHRYGTPYVAWQFKKAHNWY